MSHANATFTLEDDTVFYGEFNGTSGYMKKGVFRTIEERDSKWREDHGPECTCGKDQVVVNCDVDVDYGSGYSWEGTLCTNCMKFLGRFTPYDETRYDDWMCL